MQDKEKHKLMIGQRVRHERYSGVGTIDYVHTNGAVEIAWPAEEFLVPFAPDEVDQLKFEQSEK